MSYFLYADDDIDDQDLFREIILKIDANLHVEMFSTGLALMQYLENLSDNDELPCGILLDLNMPVWDGIRTLKAIKSHHRFLHLDVIIFTTSNRSRDQELAVTSGANSFITKPVSQNDFREVSRQLADFCDNITSK